MKVICVGFWKTGTKSMSKALTDLGYNVYDYAEQSFLLRSLWDKFFDGTVTDDDIYQALKDVDALIDGPTIVFWEEIYRVFPEAKIIITMRDEDKWWKSLKGMNDKFYSGSRAAILKYLLLTTPTGYSFTKFGNKIVRYGFGLEADNIIFSFSW
uniref:Sulfotransferase n=1 Tax=Ciona savignyi TaxID=51511 RepID=H2YWR0_CIOSA